MDHDRYGLDGMPIDPRPGHFDHVTGVRLPTFRGKSRTMGRGPTLRARSPDGHRRDSAGIGLSPVRLTSHDRSLGNMQVVALGLVREALELHGISVAKP
jgi:hypothetical protein